MKRRDEVVVGALLVVTLVLGLGGTLWIARGGLSRGYEMYAKFPWGAGLKQGQPVLLAGVNVGFVSEVELVPDGTLLVKLSVRKEYKIPIGSTATVEANGIFGDQLIALTPVRATTQFLPEKDTIPTGVGSPGIANLLSKGDSITNDVKAMTSRIRTEFVDDGGIKDIRKTMLELTKLVAQLGVVVTEQSNQLTTTQLQVRKTLASIDPAKVDSIMTNMRSASANAEKLTLAIDSTRIEVNGLIRKVNTGPGTVGKFMNDPAVYDRLDKLLARVDSITTDFQKNPRKYINLKVF
jgi:phospholipid/cholesterol/gamma-HCH transport system substrate-binding protein